MGQAPPIRTERRTPTLLDRSIMATPAFFAAAALAFFVFARAMGAPTDSAALTSIAFACTLSLLAALAWVAAETLWG